jgi:hypothetical protein
MDRQQLLLVDIPQLLDDRRHYSDAATVATIDHTLARAAYEQYVCLCQSVVPCPFHPSSDDSCERFLNLLRAEFSVDSCHTHHNDATVASRS